MSGNTARRAAITAATNYKHAGPHLDYKESPATSVFGTNVFSLATMKAHLPKEVFKSIKKTIETGATLDPARRRRRRRRDEGLGAREGRHPLRARLLSADRPDAPPSTTASSRPTARAARSPSSRARRWSRASRTRRASRTAASAAPVRGPRLHGLGRDQPRLPDGDRQRHHALHPDRVRVVDRRGARQEDAAAALEAGAQHARRSAS